MSGSSKSRNASRGHTASSPSAKRGLNRGSSGNMKSQRAHKSAQHGENRARSNGRKASRSPVATHKGNGKRNAAMNGSRRTNRLDGAQGGRGTIANGINAWSTRSDLAVWNAVPYEVTAGGFVLGGSESIRIADGFELDPGDTIVSVGGIECVESAPALPVLIKQAYRDEKLLVVIREASTGDVIEVELPASESRKE